MRYLAVVIVIATFGAHRAHRALETTTLPTPASLHETLPSIRALQYLSLGYRSVVADYYWMRAISHFGDKEMHSALYPNLAAMLRRVLALDPYFATAYFLAGTALTLRGMDPQPSIDLLEQGMLYRQDDWRIPFLLGFNAYYFKGDYVRGAEALAIAAKNPKAPKISGQLAARLAAEAGEPEIGLGLVDSILAGLQDEKLRHEYEGRRRLLELEVQLKYLNLASRRFRAGHGRVTTNVQELVSSGLLRSLPVEPLGGRYFVGADGEVRTTNDAQRLRLPTKARAEIPQP